MKKIAITAALLLTAAPAYAEDKPDWSWIFKQPTPITNEVRYLPQPVAQPVPQTIPVPYPTGGSNTPGVVVIPITTGTGGGSSTSMAELMMLKMLMDQKPEPRRKGMADVLGDVLLNTTAGFARGAAESAGRQLTNGWLQ